MLRQTLYLRLTAGGAIERCNADLDNDNLPRSLADVDANGPWIATALSLDLCYATGRSYGQLLNELVAAQDYTEVERLLTAAEQKQIGRHLYTAVFGDAPAIRERWLHIVPLLRRAQTPEEEDANGAFLDLVYRLPWALLWKGSFYVLKPPRHGSVTIDAGARAVSDWKPYETKMDPQPSLLMVIPRNYPATDPTFGDEHLASLREALPADYVNKPTRFVEVANFAQFKEKLQAMRPRILYFYGHATTNGGATYFNFDETPGVRNSALVEVGVIEAEIDSAYGAGHPPPVVWINACKGAAAEGTSFLRVLSPICAAVVTTRTLAPVSDSRALAERALPLIIRNGRAPHSAVREALIELKLSVPGARWATTVISTQYDLWSALATEDRETVDLDSTGDFPMRLDRREPLAELFAALQGSLATAEDIKPAVMIWSGQETHSLEVFARRFADNLLEKMQDRSVLEFRPTLDYDLPLRAPAGSAEGGTADTLRGEQLAAILAALEGRPFASGQSQANFADVADAIANLVRDETDLLLFMHPPFTKARWAQIADYLETWRSLCSLDIMKRHKGRIVLGFPYLLEETVSSQPSPTIANMTIAALKPVELSEMTEHLKSFARFYNWSETEIAVEAWNLLEKHDSLFRPIHRELEVRAGMVRWAEREKTEGKTNG